MDRYKKLLSIVTLAVMVMGLSIVASAQWRNDRRNNGSYGITNLDSTIKNLKNNARRFEDVLDRALDNSRYDGTRREDNLNNLADKFKDAVEDLDDEYDGYRDMNKSSDEARRVINIGQQLGNALRSSRANRNSSVQSYWRNINSDLRILANAYNSNYGNNDGYGRNDDRYGDRGNNGRYGGNRGGNNGRYSSRNLRSTIVSLKYKSARFEDGIDRARDRNKRRISGSLEDLSDRFNNAVKDLEDEYDNSRDYNDSYDEVRRVLTLGEQLDRQISQRGIDRSIRNDWNSIEQDLRTIARGFNTTYNGNNNRNGRFGDIIRNFPF